MVIVGGGGHAKVLISVVKKLPWRLAGYTDRHDVGPILGATWLGTDEVLAGYVAARPGCAALVGIGKTDAGATRTDVHGRLLQMGYVLPAVASPQAIVNEAVELGAGTVVFDGAVVNAGAVVGAGCILNTGSIVEHDCLLGVDVHVAPGAVVSGGSQVGDHCMIGAGATIIHGIQVCAGCLVGAGSVVTRHLAEPGVYVGIPVRRIR